MEYMIISQWGFYTVWVVSRLTQCNKARVCYALDSRRLFRLNYPLATVSNRPQGVIHFRSWHSKRNPPWSGFL